MIFSIGYQGINADMLKTVLDNEGIDRIIDVRSFPYSRVQYDFNRNRLQARFGSRYEWKGDILGGKDGPATEEGIDYLANLPPERSFIIMCMEARITSCHRFYDISQRLLNRGIDVTHISYGKRQGWRFYLTSQLKGETL